MKIDILMMNKKNFASDNYAGIHHKILQAMIDANHGQDKAYGEDFYTKKAVEIFKQHFGSDSDVYFVLTGTAANVLGLATCLQSYQGIICADIAHIHVDEAGSFEKYTGSKLFPIKTCDGKITIEDMQQQLSVIGNQHKVQPKIVSITQSTELGTLYTPEEIQKITDFSHAHGLYVHMDGARICNAAAALNMSLSGLTKDLGIDLLSFGGTKNGMMLGEAVIFFNKNLSEEFKYIRKQGMQLVSKMRFISAQFIALLTDGLWRKNAQHANAMSKLLVHEIKKISEIRIRGDVQANAVFAYIEPELISLLQENYLFYVWDNQTSLVRLMTSFDTTEEDVLEFVAFIKEKISR